MSKLIQSSRDDVALSSAVQSRFLDLCESYLRIRGVELNIPPSLDTDFLRWRELVARHQKGDLRHTEAEMASVKEIATWTVAVNAQMRNQKMPHIVWKEEAGIEEIKKVT